MSFCYGAYTDSSRIIHEMYFFVVYNKQMEEKETSDKHDRCAHIKRFIIAKGTAEKCSL
jgi:hypothetical protein